MKKQLYKTGVCVALLICPMAAFAQGVLTPPGAPTPTMKTLDEVEPRTPLNSTTTPGDGTSVFKITQPGSYYLTGNITGVAGQHGIAITTGNVSIDLMGFELVGVAGSLDGIRVENLSGLINYSVRNGTLRDWGGNGLTLNIQGWHRISDIRAISNGGIGIYSYNRVVVDGCLARTNGSDGIVAGGASTVSHSISANNGGKGILSGIITECSASGNGEEGFAASNGSVTQCYAAVNTGAGIIGDFGTVITGCSVIGNDGTGIVLDSGSNAIDCYARGNAIGISATDGSRIAGCTAQKNDGEGISTGNSCVIDGCVAYMNGLVTSSPGIIVGDGCTVVNSASRENNGNGIRAGVGASLSDCVAEANLGPYGIFVVGESSISHCVARANTSSTPTSAGISIGTSSSATDCVASNNASTAALTALTGMGLIAGAGSSVHHCVARGNAGDGIRAGSADTLIIGNTCVGNGSGGDGAGIHLLSSDCRVEGNNVTDNDRGIDVDLRGNLIIKNSASGNGNGSNYEIVADNKVGVIVAAPTSAAISGSTGGVGVGTTDPWANFSF